MFVQEVLENKSRVTSDAIGQFYGWLPFAYTPVLVPCLIVTQNGHYKLPNACFWYNNDSLRQIEIEIVFQYPFICYILSRWLNQNMLNFEPTVYVYTAKKLEQSPSIKQHLCFIIVVVHNVLKREGHQRGQHPALILKAENPPCPFWLPHLVPFP